MEDGVLEWTGNTDGVENKRMISLGQVLQSARLFFRSRLTY